MGLSFSGDTLVLPPSAVLHEVCLQDCVWRAFTVMSGSADLFHLDGRAGGAPGDDHRLDVVIHILAVAPRQCVTCRGSQPLRASWQVLLQFRGNLAPMASECSSLEETLRAVWLNSEKPWWGVQASTGISHSCLHLLTLWVQGRHRAGCFGLFQTVSECFRLFQVVFQDASGCFRVFRVFQDVLGYFRVFQHVSGCFMVFWDVSGCFRLFWGFSGCFRVFLHVSGCFGVFQDLSGCFSMLQDVSQCFGLI